MNLFPHQEEAAAAMASNMSFLLADEPGLGKTASAIAAALRTPQGHCCPWLIVCPRNAVKQWRDELKTWAPGKDDVIITNPERFKKLDLFKAHLCRVIIFDEAHLFKNIESKRFRAFYPFTQNPLNRVYALTGTPIWSYPVDLFALLVLLRVVRLEQYGAFVTHFCDPSMRFWPGRGRFLDVRGASNLGKLESLLHGHFLRRSWNQVGIAMPPLTFTDVSVEIDPTDEYKTAAEDFTAWYAETYGKEAPPLARFTLLRRILATAKIKGVMDRLDNDLQSGVKILVFSEFREPVERLHAKYPNSFLVEGGQAEGVRNQILDAFRAAPAPAVMFATTKSLNVAVNLQAANLVYFLDLGFEPATFEQAFRRAWRMGQARPVNIVRFFVEGDDMETFILKNILNKERIQAELGLQSSAAIGTLQAGIQP